MRRVNMDANVSSRLCHLAIGNGIMNIKIVRIMGVLGLAIIILSSCSRPSVTDFLIGGIYSVTGNANEFRIVKVVTLNEDEGIVQIYMYQKSYPHRPETLDPETLKLDPIHNGKSIGMSIGSLPLHLSEFLARKPRLIMVTEVTTDEQKSTILATRKP